MEWMTLHDDIDQGSNKSVDRRGDYDDNNRDVNQRSSMKRVRFWYRLSINSWLLSNRMKLEEELFESIVNKAWI
jgi:hypothetical protein